MSVKEKKVQKSRRISKVSSSSESDDDSEHELSYYTGDRVKLMKHVLKILKPKKIKSMAPDGLKKFNITELNSMLLEELLGISNKRLKHILNGVNVDVESSSSDSDEEAKPIDVISLDDISTDDDLTFLDSTEVKISASGNSHRKKHKKRKMHIKAEKKSKDIKKEKSTDKIESEKSKQDDKFMNVLELLELQARARAIRSQLSLEAMNKKKTNEPSQEIKIDSDPEAVIIDIPRSNAIVIFSSESEDDVVVLTEDNLVECNVDKDVRCEEIQLTAENKKIQKVKIVRQKEVLQTKEDIETTVQNTNNKSAEEEGHKKPSTETIAQNDNKSDKVEGPHSDSENDEIILNIDAEMEGMENEILNCST